MLLSLTSDMTLKGCATSFIPQLGSVSKNMGFHFWSFLKIWGCLCLEHYTYDDSHDCNY